MVPEQRLNSRKQRLVISTCFCDIRIPLDAVFDLDRCCEDLLFAFIFGFHC